MSDWADEIAFSLQYNEDHRVGGIATALRKAKADGMREAVDRIRNNGDLDRLEIADELTTRADKIERGE